MEILDAKETASRLPYPALADAIRDVALARASGGVEAPPRTALALPGEAGFLLVMPASDETVAMTKIVTVHPGNAERGLPTIRGEVVVMEAATGTRLGILDGSVVTARRTAALSLLAARELAPRPDAPLLVVGAGAQARAHVEAFREGLGTREVSVASRTVAKAEDLAEHARGLGMEARVAAEPAEALGDGGVGLVVTATTSRKPVLPEGVPDGMFVAAVGSFEPEAAELPPGLVSRAAVVVDTVEGAREEAGDLIQAEEADAFSWEEANALADALRTPERFKEAPPGTVVFKSVGHALWDLAAARTVFADEAER